MCFSHRDTPLNELIEATLRGQGSRLMARCDMSGILAALDAFGIFDLGALASTLDTLLPAL